MGGDWAKDDPGEQSLGFETAQKVSDVKPEGASYLGIGGEEDGSAIGGHQGLINDARYFSKMPLILKHQAFLFSQLFIGLWNLNSKLFQITSPEAIYPHSFGIQPSIITTRVYQGTYYALNLTNLVEILNGKNPKNSVRLTANRNCQMAS